MRCGSDCRNISKLIFTVLRIYVKDEHSEARKNIILMQNVTIAESVRKKLGHAVSSLATEGRALIS